MDAMKRNLYNAIQIYFFDKDRRNGIDLTDKSYDALLTEKTKRIFKDITGEEYGL